MNTLCNEYLCTSKIALFRELDEKEQQKIASSAEHFEREPMQVVVHENEREPMQVVVHENERADYILIIREGKVKLKPSILRARNISSMSKSAPISSARNTY